MIAYLPIPGGHITLAERFVDPPFAFAMGWNYWYDHISVSWVCLQLTANISLFFRYNWVIVLPAELSAASVLIGFWNKTVSGAVWITICMVVVVAINLMGAGERFHLIQKSHFSLIVTLAPLRRLWRGWIYFRASGYTSFRVTRIWHSIHSSIKVITITGLIILGIVLDLGGKLYPE